MARYDAIADWYDAYVTGDKARITAIAQTALDLLGSGPGRCLDLCCGGGVHIPELRRRGWTVVGVDESEEQLRVARERLPDVELVRADAHALPFEDDSFDAVAALFVHTDVDDVGSVVREVARVLRAGGRLVLVGSHPCFVSPNSELRPDGTRVLHPGYRVEGWTREGPGIGSRIRSRVGVRHVTLTTLVSAVLDAGLTLERLEEPGEDDPPALITLAARG